MMAADQTFRLITSGPYRYVRHPFHVATALAFAANALTTANSFIAVTGFAAPWRSW